MMNNKKRLIILGVVLGIVIVLLVIGLLSASHQAKSYNAALKTWKQQDRTKLLAAVPTQLNDAAYPIGVSDQTTLDNLKNACQGYQTVVNNLQSNKYEPPKLSSNILGFTSSSYRHAKSTQKLVNNKVQPYVAEAQRDYAQINKDCQFIYGAYSYDFANYLKYTKLWEATKQPNGTTVNDITCDNPDGCYPQGNEALKDYAKYYRLAFETRSVNRVNDKALNAKCAGTLIAKLCPQNRDYTLAVHPSVEAWLHAIETSSVSVTGTTEGDNINRLSDAMDQEQDKQTAILNQRTRKAFPSITITDDNAYVGPIAKMLETQQLAKLTPKAIAIKNL